MKKIFFFILASVVFLSVRAQEFEKQLVSARTAYTGGKLEDARFAMQQLLQELDIKTGKEILKLLPQKMNDQAANAAADNVSGASGYFGVVIHRDYGTVPEKKVDLDIISNSPMISSINSLLSLPFVGNTGDNRVIKISGFKALLQKVSGNEGEKPSYELQLPINSTLITFKAPGYTQDDVIKMANTLPVAEIAKMVQ